MLNRVGRKISAAPEPLASPHDAMATVAMAEMRKLLPDLYFINTPSARMAHHLDLLRRVETEHVIIEFQRRPHSSLTELTVCAYDDIEPGLLSKLCGVLASRRIDIQTAFVFTVDRKASPTGAQIVLDTLYIHAGHGRALSTGATENVRADLARVLGRELSVAQLLTQSYLKAHPPVDIQEITFVNSAIGDRTIITLRAQNAPGILYRTTAALSAMGLDIRVAQINTEENRTNDVFFVVNKKENAVPDAELQGLTANFKSLLQGNSVPPGIGV